MPICDFCYTPSRSHWSLSWYSSKFTKLISLDVMFTKAESCMYNS